LYEKLKEYIDATDDPRENILEVLIVAQNLHGKLSEETIGYIGSLCDITSEEIRETIEFFPFLIGDSTEIEICHGFSCSMRGARHISEALSDMDTHITETPCRGLCSKAPNIWVDGKHYPTVTPERLEEIKILLNTKK